MPLAPECTVSYALFYDNDYVLTQVQDGACKTQSDYEADLAVLKETSTIVRTYANVDGGDPSGPLCYVPGALLPAAKAAGMKVILGVWYGDLSLPVIIIDANIEKQGGH